VFSRSATRRPDSPPNGVRPLLGGADRQPGLDLGRPGRLGGGGGGLPVDGFGLEHRCLLGAVQSLLQLHQFGHGPLPAGLQFVALPDQPLPVAVGAAGVLAEPAELLVDGRNGGVGLVERGQRLLGGVLSGRQFGQRAGQRRAQFTDLRFGRCQFGAGPVDLGGDLQRAGLAVRTPADPATAD
jgi:hypothetical protein